MLQHHLHMKSLLTLLLLYTNHNLSTQPLWKNCSVCIYIYIYVYNIYTHTCIHTCWYKTYLLSNLNQATYTWASHLRKRSSSKLNIICPMALRNLVLASNTSLPIWNAVQFGPIQSSSVHFGPIQSTWSNLVQFQSLWSNSAYFSPLWSNLIHLLHFGPPWCFSIYFSPFRSLFSISVHFGLFSPF